MSTSVTGPAPRALVFTETMYGPFALGESEPSRGVASGRTSRTTLTMRVTISIADVDAFARDPSHAAALSGRVTFDPLGAPLSSVDGVVRLFAPAESAKKVMYYGLAFSHDGRALYLAGSKHVDGRSVFALWPETTTLHTRLHEGPDETAPVIGAGVLRLSPLNLVRTLPTMRPSSHPVATLARFGEFFVGELWDSYVVRRPPAASTGANAPRV